MFDGENGYRKLFEEDAVEENGKFRPAVSVHFQIGDGSGRQVALRFLGKVVADYVGCGRES